MNAGYAVAVILVMTAATVLTRALPFLLFDRGGEPPKLILYLGRVLPPAVMAMLVVYCLKDTSFSTLVGWLPQLLGVAAVAALHKWRHNTLISLIALGPDSFLIPALVVIVAGLALLRPRLEHKEVAR